jgi:hypothetical protein
VKHITWAAAPSYEELNILVTQAEAYPNSRPLTVLLNDANELIGTVYSLHIGIQTAWDTNPAWVLGEKTT